MGRGRPSGADLDVIICLNLDPRDDLPKIIGLGDDGTIGRHGRDDILKPPSRKALLVQIGGAECNETEQGVVGIAINPHPGGDRRAHATAAATATAMTAWTAKIAVELMAFGRGAGFSSRSRSAPNSSAVGSERCCWTRRSAVVGRSQPRGQCRQSASAAFLRKGRLRTAGAGRQSGLGAENLPDALAGLDRLILAVRFASGNPRRPALDWWGGAAGCVWTYSPGPYDLEGSCPWPCPWAWLHGAHLLCRFPGIAIPRPSWPRAFLPLVPRS